MADRRRALPRRGRDRRRRRQLGRAGGGAPRLAGAQRARSCVRGTALKSTMSHYLVDRIERSPRIEVMTETEVAAVHGAATVESVSLRDRRDGSVRAGAGDRRVRDDRRRAVHRGGDRDARGRRRRLPAVRHGRGDVRRPPRLAAGATASRICSRRSARACSRPATCARARPTAWRARSATARWPCASRTTCWPAERSAGRPWRQINARLAAIAMKADRDCDNVWEIDEDGCFSPSPILPLTRGIALRAQCHAHTARQGCRSGGDRGGRWQHPSRVRRVVHALGDVQSRRRVRARRCDRAVGLSAAERPARLAGQPGRRLDPRSATSPTTRSRPSSTLCRPRATASRPA